jgi:hypothetical protein
LTNIDVFFCTNFKSILHYIAKYCFKVETKSFKLKIIVQSVFFHVSSKAFILSLVNRLMNKLIAKRNWNAQKICHHLLKKNWRIRLKWYRHSIYDRMFNVVIFSNSSWMTSRRTSFSLRNIVLVLRNKRS